MAGERVAARKSGQPDANGEHLHFEMYDVISIYIIAVEQNEGLPLGPIGCGLGRGRMR